MTLQTTRFAGKPWWQIPSASDSQIRWTEPQQPAKGDYNGMCQRFDCTNPDAHWYNPSTGRYLCSPCARAMTQAQRRNGGPTTLELHLGKWSAGKRI